MPFVHFPIKRRDRIDPTPEIEKWIAEVNPQRIVDMGLGKGMVVQFEGECPWEQPKLEFAILSGQDTIKRLNEISANPNCTIEKWAADDEQIIIFYWKREY